MLDLLLGPGDVTFSDCTRKSAYPTIFTATANMGVQKKTRKFATVKRIIGQRDARLKKNQGKAEIESKKKNEDEVIREVYEYHFRRDCNVLTIIGHKCLQHFSSSTTLPSYHLTTFWSIPTSYPTLFKRNLRCYQP